MILATGYRWCGLNLAGRGDGVDIAAQRCPTGAGDIEQTLRRVSFDGARLAASTVVPADGDAAACFTSAIAAEGDILGRTCRDAKGAEHFLSYEGSYRLASRTSLAPVVSGSGPLVAVGPLWATRLTDATGVVHQVVLVAGGQITRDETLPRLTVSALGRSRCAIASLVADARSSTGSPATMTFISSARDVVVGVQGDVLGEAEWGRSIVEWPYEPAAVLIVVRAPEPVGPEGHPETLLRVDESGATSDLGTWGFMGRLGSRIWVPTSFGLLMLEPTLDSMAAPGSFRFRAAVLDPSGTLATEAWFPELDQNVSWKAAVEVSGRVVVIGHDDRRIVGAVLGCAN